MTIFWKGKKVLLTGHTGFKGSWLSLVLQMLGADVIGFALPPATNPNLFESANVSQGMTNIFGNICEFQNLLNIFKKHQPDIVIHMAAQALVRHSYKAPIETYASNVLGTVHVLEAARQTGSVKAIINVTTDKCYENNEWLWGYRENDKLGGHDPYSNSKACAELVTECYRHSFFDAQKIGLASARAGNVIGGGDWSQDRLIPDIIRAFQNKLPFSIRNPNALRPWQHVLEPLTGYLLLAEKLYTQPDVFNSAWNFGPDKEDTKPVSSIADYMVKHWHESADWEHILDNQLHETTHLALDSSKARNFLGWKPRWNLDKSLEKTLDWYRAFFEGVDVRRKTVTQIEEFFSEQSSLVVKAAYSLEV